MTETTNDTEVFDAMRFDVVSGDMVWTGHVGTREAIRRERLAIDPGSWSFCPHQWLDEQGFVDRELSRKHPQSWPPILYSSKISGDAIAPQSKSPRDTGLPDR
jgi:hypothetical protein